MRAAFCWSPRLVATAEESLLNIVLPDVIDVVVW
jgi:hypothetical protein